MRLGVSKEWLQKFKEGFDRYLQGKWEQAIILLKQVNEERKGANILKEADGPSTTLLNYMIEQGGTAPNEWPGYRELTEK